MPVTAWVLFRTRFGLRLRAVGENPKAIDTAGISVTRLRYQALIITAVLVGIGGTYLSIAQSAGFNNNMSNGRGYIALAALIFAKWRPGPALLVCLLFGFLDALQFRLQGVQFPHHRRGAGAGHPGAALRADHHPAGRLHRPRRRAEGLGHPLHQGTLK